MEPVKKVKKTSEELFGPTESTSSVPQEEGFGWLMTYGDLMTLLLCFFMLFFKLQDSDAVLQKVKEKKKQKDVTTATLTKKDNELLKLLKDLKKHLTHEELVKLLKDWTKEVLKKIIEKKLSEAEKKLLNKDESKMQKRLDEILKKIPVKELNRILEQILQKNQQINAIKEEVKDIVQKTLKDEVVKFVENKEFLEIIFPNKTFFRPATANPLPLAKQLFLKFSKMIARMEYPVDIEVQGHTDSDKIRSRTFPSNWELSTARASTIVRLLITYGVPANRLSAKGFADQQQVLPERDKKGRKLVENQKYNRRIVLRITKFVDRKKRKPKPEKGERKKQ